MSLDSHASRMSRDLLGRPVDGVSIESLELGVISKEPDEVLESIVYDTHEDPVSRPTGWVVFAKPRNSPVTIAAFGLLPYYPRMYTWFAEGDAARERTRAGWVWKS